MNENDNELLVAGGCLSHVIAFAIGALLMAMMFTSCKTEYITVPEVHDVHHYHTDSIHQRDSIFRDSKTTIMQLDSAAMAKYGIRLNAAERAWLVRTQELEYQLQQLAKLQRDSTHRVDSIPVPYPVIKEVERQLTWWQQFRLHVGNIALMLLAFLAVCYLLRRKWPLP